MVKNIILVVDDEKNIVHLLKEYLEAKGFSVETGYDGQMALALARAHQPSLIIMDVDMPRMNGLQALAALRKDATTQAIPVIMLTGVVSAEIFPAIEAIPKVSHVKKPVSLEDLGSLVTYYLSEPADPEK